MLNKVEFVLKKRVMRGYLRNRLYTYMHSVPAKALHEKFIFLCDSPFLFNRFLSQHHNSVLLHHHNFKILLNSATFYYCNNATERYYKITIERGDRNVLRQTKGYR
jgi:hypothetical protein